MELDPTAEDDAEEYRLEAHNEEQDARAFIGIGNDDAPGADTEREMCLWAISKYFGD